MIEIYAININQFIFVETQTEFPKYCCWLRDLIKQTIQLVYGLSVHHSTTLFLVFSSRYYKNELTYDGIVYNQSKHAYRFASQPARMCTMAGFDAPHQVCKSNKVRCVSASMKWCYCCRSSRLKIGLNRLMSTKINMCDIFSFFSTGISISVSLEK
jgi:hypothetical protein